MTQPKSTPRIGSTHRARFVPSSSLGGRASRARRARGAPGAARDDLVDEDRLARRELADVRRSLRGRRAHDDLVRRGCFARARPGKKTSTLREMIARPNISRNERNATEIEVEHVAPFSCPEDDAAVALDLEPLVVAAVAAGRRVGAGLGLGTARVAARARGGGTARAPRGLGVRHAHAGRQVLEVGVVGVVLVRLRLRRRLRRRRRRLRALRGPLRRLGLRRLGRVGAEEVVALLLRLDEVLRGADGCARGIMRATPTHREGLLHGRRLAGGRRRRHRRRAGPPPLNRFARQRCAAGRMAPAPRRRAAPTRRRWQRRRRRKVAYR